MFPTFLIGLREGLEASLVVGILVAYLVKTGRRDRLAPLWGGIALAVAISLGFGALLQFTSAQMSFRAQEAFGGFASLLAVAFVTWMVFWMRRTARFLKTELHGRLDTALTLGPLALALTAFVAVGREGLETALFLWSAVQSTGETASPIVGATLGLAASVALGYLLYQRAVTLNLKTFFTWTGAGLVVVAAGVFSYGVHDLQEAGLLPGLNTLAFDVSSTISPSSWYGTLLKGIFNFSPRTSVLEAVVWVGYVVPVLYLFFRAPRATAAVPPRPPPGPPRSPDRAPPAPHPTPTPPMPGALVAMRPSRPLVLAAAPLLAVLTACGGASDSTGGTARTVAVTSTADACEVASTDLPAGRTTFAVRNSGSDVTEVYVYAQGSGGAYDKVVGEVENIAPSTSRDFPVTLVAGTYEVACKPGQTGDGIRTTVTVTGGAPAATGSGSPAAVVYDREVELTLTDAGLGGLDAFTGKAGEKIEFKVTNSTSATYEVKFLDPSGTLLGEVPPTAPGAEGEVVVELAVAGVYSAVPVDEDAGTNGAKVVFTVS